jgi:enoyl-CoA hydratase
MTDEVLVRSVGRALRITLNRPRAINALTLDMVRSIEVALDQAEEDRAIATVILDGAGDRGLCAGGDIRALYEAALAGDRGGLQFWREEYALDARLARFPKPVVAVMDGIVMGGGIGISAHAPHRIVTERSSVGMPEVGIGFSPDVGGTWLLARAPGELGTHVALTGASIDGPDAIACGLADRLVPSASVTDLIEALADSNLDSTIDRFAVTPERLTVSGLIEDRTWIDETYSANTVESIIDRLAQQHHEAARLALDRITGNSPTALKVALRALREASQKPTLEACLEMEFRISRTFLLDTPDFTEGVRAAVVDKDRSPQWRPQRLGDVTPERVEQFFVPGDDDLQLDDRQSRHGVAST